MACSSRSPRWGIAHMASSASRHRAVQHDQAQPSRAPALQCHSWRGQCRGQCSKRAAFVFARRLLPTHSSFSPSAVSLMLPAVGDTAWRPLLESPSPCRGAPGLPWTLKKAQGRAAGLGVYAVPECDRRTPQPCASRPWNPHFEASAFLFSNRKICFRLRIML